MAVCVKQNSRWSSEFCVFLVESRQSLFGQDQATDDQKTLQHTSSIPFTYNWIGSFLFLFVRSAQGACETRAFSFVSRRKHLLKREGLLKISTSSRISIPVTCAQCSQRFCERRCLLYPSRQLVSLAVCCHHCKLGVIHPSNGRGVFHARASFPIPVT